MNDHHKPESGISTRKLRALMRKLETAGIDRGMFFAPLSATAEELEKLAAAWPQAKVRVRKGGLMRIDRDKPPHAIFNPQFEASRFEQSRMHGPEDDAQKKMYAQSFEFFDNGWSIRQLRRYCMKHDYSWMTDFCNYEYLEREPFMSEKAEPGFRRIVFKSIPADARRRPEDILVSLPFDHALPSAREMVMALLHFRYYNLPEDQLPKVQYYLTCNRHRKKAIRVGWYTRSEKITAGGLHRPCLFAEIDVTFRFGSAYGNLLIPRLLA